MTQGNSKETTGFSKTLRSVAVALPFLLLFLLASQVSAQTEEPEKKKDFNKVRPGMKEVEVKKVVGNPEVIERFKTIVKGTKDTTTYWRYENDLTIIFKNHLVERIERDHNTLLQKIQDWADPNNKDGIRLIYGK